MKLEEIIAHGNRGHFGSPDGHITCADGFRLSVIAGGGTYCSPRPAPCYSIGAEHHTLSGGFGSDVDCTYSGPYYAVEVGFPSERPEPWGDDDDDPRSWRTYAETADDPTGTVYGRVPVEMLRALVAAHGGER